MTISKVWLPKSQAQRPSFPIWVWNTHVLGEGCGFEVKSERGFGVWKTGRECLSLHGQCLVVGYTSFMKRVT